jgi:hypothetical protein
MLMLRSGLLASIATISMMKISTGNCSNSAFPIWLFRLSQHRRDDALLAIEESLNNLNAFIPLASIGLAAVANAKTWTWSQTGGNVTVAAIRPNVSDGAWFLLLQILRSIDRDFIEISHLTLAPEHENFASMTIDAFSDWCEFDTPFSVQLDHTPPEMNIRIHHNGDQDDSNILLQRLSVWFSVVSEGAFADATPPTSDGWIGLDDMPECRQGVVSLNLTNVACNEVAFQALQAVIFNFHVAIATVDEFVLN